MSSSIFITGLYRSGTTLVDKILQNHPENFIASQPISSLYYEVKKQFLQSINKASNLPLGNLFRSNTTIEFSSYLKKIVLNKDLIIQIIKEQTKTPKLENNFLKNLNFNKENGHFIDYFDLINLHLSKMLDENPKVIGSKEIFCEEYIPYFLSNGVKVILLIRDPRDIITSLNFGRGADFTGDIRPTLFNIRNWRKSAAFAINYRNHKNLLCIKYEDLITDTEQILYNISQFLNIREFNKSFLNEGIKDQYGRVWKGNSSHNVKNTIDQSSMHRYKTQLDEKTIDYIETVCYPEMNFFNYNNNVNINKYNNIINSFKEPFKIQRREFSSFNYTENKKHVEEEIKRLEYLQSEPCKKTIDEWFIFHEAFRELKNYIHL